MEIPKILIVDDEQVVLDFLQSLINAKLECQIQTAQDGKEALEKLKDNPVDLLLLDIKMPGLSGIDVIKNVMEISPGTLILAISAYDSQEIATQAIKVGAVDYILKTHTTQEIESKIKAVLTHLGKYSPKNTKS
jgi:YesN/AraC family two-component response regulator